MIRSGRVLLVPAGDQAPGGREVAPQAGRLILGDHCSIAAADASLIETPACGTYLRAERTTPLDADEGIAVAVEPEDLDTAQADLAVSRGFCRV